MNRWILTGLLLAATTAYARPDPAKRAVVRTGPAPLVDAAGRFQLRTTPATTPGDGDQRFVLVQSSLISVDTGPAAPAARFALMGTDTGTGGSGGCGTLPDELFDNGFEN